MCELRGKPANCIEPNIRIDDAPLLVAAVECHLPVWTATRKRDSSCVPEAWRQSEPSTAVRGREISRVTSSSAPNWPRPSLPVYAYPEDT
jgi:hypothetical protein